MLTGAWLRVVISTAAAGLILVGLAPAQTPDPQRSKPYVPRKIVLSPQPVTRKEAKAIFQKMDICLAKVVHAQKSSDFANAGAQPVTRAEIIDQFAKMFEAASPAFTFTPKKVAFDASLLTVKQPPSRTHLETLIAWGCVDRVGPLATSAKDTLGVLEFGDAVGFFLARIAQLSHYPDPRFTPELEP